MIAIAPSEIDVTTFAEGRPCFVLRGEPFGAILTAVAWWCQPTHLYNFSGNYSSQQGREQPIRAPFRKSLSSPVAMIDLVHYGRPGRGDRFLAFLLGGISRDLSSGGGGRGSLRVGREGGKDPLRNLDRCAVRCHRARVIFAAGCLRQRKYGREHF